MKVSLQSLLASFLLACAGLTCTSVGAISASSDATMPAQQTSHGLSNAGTGQEGFFVAEDVQQNPNFGPWRKSLINTRGSGIASGVDVPLSETLTNTGSSPWTDWHERVLSRTNILNPDDAPGFLFQADSLIVQADYGGGVVTLVQGVDYTRIVTPYSGPMDPGNNGHWEAIDILFAPNRVIGSGDVLIIQKRIFEVFGDGNVWQPGIENAALIGEFPTSVPEPAGCGAALAVVCIACRRRRNKHNGDPCNSWCPCWSGWFTMDRRCNTPTERLGTP